MDQFIYILLWFTVGFLIADYPLQLNVVFQLRYKYRHGGLVHVAIHAVTGLFFIYPYLAHWQIWAAFAATTVAHYFIDTLNKKNIFMWLGDQVTHLLLIAAVACLCRNLQPTLLPAPFAPYYLNIPFALYVVGYLTAGFTGTIFVFFVKQTWWRDYRGAPRPILLYEKVTGVLARVMVVTAVVLAFKISPAFLLVAPVPDLFRIYHVLSSRGAERHYKNVYVPGIVISFLYAAAIGVALAFV
jgi:hypothetical protein